MLKNPKIIPDFFLNHQKMISYHDLMAFVEKHQTSYIKPLYFEKSCAPSRIPFSFVYLIPEIFKIIALNFKAISLGKSHIGIFGLQPSCAIAQKDMRFYCTLLYLPLSAYELKIVSNWQGAKNLIIDFTTGYIMSPEQYLSSMLTQSLLNKENTYGQLPQDILALAWKAHNTQNLVLH